MQNTSNLPPTKFAQKYGMWGPLISHKSGLTPINDLFPRFSIPNNEKALNSYLIAYQRANLFDFTTAELQDLDCLPTRDLRGPTLQNEIIPLLQRDRWEETVPPNTDRTSLYPLNDGRGMWVASNDVVWEALVPSLKIASRVLNSIHVMPWFDALLNGERKVIPLGRRRQQDVSRIDLMSFHQRPLQAFRPELATENDRDNAFSGLMNTCNLTFRFMNDTEHPAGSAYPPTKTLGMTSRSPDAKGINIYMDLRALENLLRKDLSSGDKMMAQWLVSDTICHEVMHALAKLAGDPLGVTSSDRYFEDEPLSEVGFSYEQCINGGQIASFVPQSGPDENLPLGYWFRRYWPTWDVISASGWPVLDNPEPLRDNEYYPIPISFYEDIQQESFWGVGVRQYGHKIFHFRALKEGFHDTMMPDSLSQFGFRSGPGARISGNNPFPITQNSTLLSNAVQQKLAETIGREMQLTPEQRNVIIFGIKLLDSSHLQEKFWAQSTQQAASISSLNTLLATDTSSLDPAQQVNYFRSMINYVHNAISNHSEMVAILLQSESTASTEYSNRRQTLLEWNRGTRVFLTQLAVTAINDQNLEEEQLRLECVRMNLVDPESWPDPTIPESREIRSIRDIQRLIELGDLQGAANICNQRLLNAMETSLFAICYADTVLFYLGRHDPVGWLDRRDRLAVAERRLLIIHNSLPEKWIEWVDRAISDVLYCMGLAPP